MVVPLTGAQLICPYRKCVAYAGCPPPASTAHTAITLSVAPKTCAPNAALRGALFILPFFVYRMLGSGFLILHPETLALRSWATHAGARSNIDVLSGDD